MDPELSAAHNAAYQAGQVVGTIAVGLLSLGALVFFIVAVVKAFTRKTTGWIVTAVVMGLLGAAMAVAMVSAFVVGVSRAVAENGALSKVLKSRDAKYQITVPNSWRPLPELNAQASMAAGNVFNEQYLMVLIEEKGTVTMDLDSYMKFTADRMVSHLKNGAQEEATELNIGGHRAIRRKVTGQTEKVNLAYLHTCLETEDSLVQIISWTLAGRESKAFPTFEQVAATFSRSGITSPAKAAATPASKH